MSLSTPRLDASHALKCEMAGEVLRSSGQLRLQAIGWSMLPTIWPGDVLVIEPLQNEDVVEGDIVVFTTLSRFVGHRVVKKDRALRRFSVHTQGDALACPDSPVTDCDLKGRVSLVVRGRKSLSPGRKLSVFQRALASLFRRSALTARIAVRVRRVYLSLLAQASRTRNSLAHRHIQIPNDRAVPCRS